MKKIILLAIMFIASTIAGFTQSNSNSFGTIQIGIGGGGQVGYASITQSSPYYGSLQQDAFVASSNYGLRAQFGLSKRFSVGGYLKKESAVYAEDGTTLSYKGVKAGFEGKYYPVNKEKFNFYVGPTIGYAGGKLYDSDNSNNKSNLSGFNYSVGVGLNWYWTQYIGMSVDLGYTGMLASGDYNYISTGYIYNGDMKIKSYGVYLGLGLISRFGGKN